MGTTAEVLRVNETCLSHSSRVWQRYLLGCTEPCTFEPLRSVRGGTRPEECRNSWPRFDGCLETLRAKLALGWAWRFAQRSEHSSLDFVEVDAVPPAHHGRCS